MIPTELLSRLCCPETHQHLRAADPALLGQLNAKIKAGALRNRGGRVVREKLEDGLVRLDGRVLYPVDRGIPVMLPEESIALITPPREEPRPAH